MGIFIAVNVLKITQINNKIYNKETLPIADEILPSTSLFISQSSILFHEKPNPLIKFGRFYSNPKRPNVFKFGN